MSGTINAPSGLQKGGNLEVQFGSKVDDPDVIFTHADWTLSLDLNMQENELILNAELTPNKWLAIALSSNFIETDIVQWIAGAEAISE